MISFDFSGRVALVTGGASGIGADVAGRLIAAGAAVTIFDRDADAVARVAGAIGARPVVGDVTRSADLDAAVADMDGVVDILVCSAGVSGDSLPTVAVSDAEWERVLAINASGVFFANRAVIPGMVERGYGRIVNIASIAGKEGNPMACAYSASKAAVIGLTKAIGKDLATTGVLVNAIAPAVVETPILASMTEEHVAYMASKVPMGRLGRPAEVSTLIMYLASDAMTFSTAAVHDLSGGRATY